MDLTGQAGYQQLLAQISDTYTQGRLRAVQAVNAQLIESYWLVGRHIVEFEQAGQVRAEYGKALISSLATDLGLRHGKGFSRSNLIRIRQFYLAYPISATVSHQLTWSHIVELLKIDDPLEPGDVQHHDIGQMNLYLGYFAAEQSGEGDNPPIGIILGRQKDELLVEYATYCMNSQLFVQKYQLYLPDREALRAELERVAAEVGR